MTILAFALQLLNALPPLLAAGIQVTELIQASQAKIKAMQDEGRDPTQAEWDEQDARIMVLRDVLHLPDVP